MRNKSGGGGGTWGVGGPRRAKADVSYYDATWRGDLRRAPGTLMSGLQPFASNAGVRKGGSIQGIVFPLRSNM